MARYSPGTSCQTGSPRCRPNGILRPSSCGASRMPQRYSGILHVIELGPALGIDRDRGAQIDQRLLEALRPHRPPPVDVARMPALQRAQHRAILGRVRRCWESWSNNRRSGCSWHSSYLLFFASPSRLSCVMPAKAGIPLGGAALDHPLSRMTDAQWLSAANRRITPSSYRTPAAGRCRSASARPLRRPRWGAGRSSSARR